jgi:hypothetical protein
MKYTAKEKDAMTAIGHYYLNKYSEPDDYPNLSKAKRDIKNLLITRVIYSDSELDIYISAILTLSLDRVERISIGLESSLRKNLMIRSFRFILMKTGSMTT